MGWCEEWGKREGASWPTYRLEGEENQAGDRRSYGEGRDLRRRENLGRRKRKAYVTLASAVGGDADMRVPHVSGAGA